MKGVYKVKRGDVYYADLRPVIGSEQGGVRPVLIIQNDIGNKHSPTIICAAITSKMNKAKLPTHIELSAGKYEMEKDSVILLEQLRTIDKKRLKDKVCHLDEDIMKRVNHGQLYFIEPAAFGRYEFLRLQCGSEGTERQRTVRRDGGSQK